MSYSFSIIAASKALALVAISAEVDKIVASQPVHDRDRPAILKNADATVSLLADDDTKDVHVSCNGYLTWNGIGSFDPTVANLSTVSISSTASLRDRA